MKEEKEKSLVICDIDYKVKYLNSDETFDIKKEENNISETPLLKENEENFIIKTEDITDESSSSKEMATEVFFDSDAHDVKESKPSKANIGDQNSIHLDNKMPSQTKLILRPRKTETNTGSDCESKIKKQKLIVCKAENKSAIISEDNFLFNDTSNSISDPTVDVSQNLENDNFQVPVSKIIENSEMNNAGTTTDCCEKIIENETNNFESPSNLNPVFETGFEVVDGHVPNINITSVSRIKKLKNTKRKKKRRDNGWTKKRKRTDNHQVVKNLCTVLESKEIQIKNDESITQPISKSVNLKKKDVEGCEIVQKKPREFAIPSPSLADISVKAAIPESTATSLEVKTKIKKG